MKTSAQITIYSTQCNPGYCFLNFPLWNTYTYYSNNPDPSHEPREPGSQTFIQKVWTFLVKNLYSLEVVFRYQILLNCVFFRQRIFHHFIPKHS